jgi:hypothetical protein
MLFSPRIQEMYGTGGPLAGDYQFVNGKYVWLARSYGWAIV